MRARLEAFMEFIAQRAGKFFFLVSVFSVVYGVLDHLVIGRGYDEVPDWALLLFLIGLLGLVFSFVKAGRATGGERPTMPMLAFAYLFGLSFLLVAVRRIDATAWMPDVPDPLISGIRIAVLVMTFVAAWVAVFGTSYRRDWWRLRTDPWPFGALYRRRRGLTGESKGEGDD